MEFNDNDPFQYELHEGELMKKNAPALRAPTPWPQRVSGNLYTLTRQHITEKS